MKVCTSKCLQKMYTRMTAHNYVATLELYVFDHFLLIKEKKLSEVFIFKVVQSSSLCSLENGNGSLWWVLLDITGFYRFKPLWEKTEPSKSLDVLFWNHFCDGISEKPDNQWINAYGIT